MFGSLKFGGIVGKNTWVVWSVRKSRGVWPIRYWKEPSLFSEQPYQRFFHIRLTRNTVFEIHAF